MDLLARALNGDKSIREMLQVLPSSLCTFVGQVAIPTDGGLSISEAIVGGTCVGASDGSLMRQYKNTKGSHRYALGSKDQDIKEIQE